MRARAGGVFRALAASTAVLELHPTRTARLVSDPDRVAQAFVAEQFAFVFTVDAGLGEDQVDGVPQGDIQGRCELQLSTLEGWPGAV